MRDSKEELKRLMIGLRGLPKTSQLIILRTLISLSLGFRGKSMSMVSNLLELRISWVDAKLLM